MLIVDTPFPPYKPVEYVRPVAKIPSVDDEIYGWSEKPEGTDFTLLSASGFSKIQSDPKTTPVKTSKWVAKSGQTTRSDGRPAWIRTSSTEDGKTTVKGLKWLNNGWHHRDGDLPAIVSFWKAEAAIVLFLKKGLKHRFNGPAYMQPHTAKKDRFYLYGIPFSEADFFEVHACAIKHSIPLWVATVYIVTNSNFQLDANLDTKIWALPFEWQWKMLKFTEDELWMVVLSGDSRGQTKKVTQIAAVVKHEQKEFLHNWATLPKISSTLKD